MKYTIRPSLAEEALESWVWTNNANVSENGFIIIKYNGKKIKTFKRTLDENFAETYNDKKSVTTISLTDKKNYLVMNEYYRKRLSLEKNKEYELDINEASRWDKIFFIQCYHPNPTVQFANRATIFSIILGLIALGFAIWSIYLALKPVTPCLCNS